MTNNNELYYIPVRSDIPDAPLLSYGENNPNLSLAAFLEVSQPLNLILSDPEPPRPNMVDYHSLPNSSVFSTKIKDVLEAMNIFGIQLLPARIKISKSNFVDYWYIHIFNRIANCLDMENSVYRFWEKKGIITNMSKILLDNDKIKKIPLEERLVFKLTEYKFKEIYHESVVEKIMQVSPEGVEFWTLADWDISV